MRSVVFLVLSFSSPCLSAYADVECDVVQTNHVPAITRLNVSFANFDLDVSSVQPSLPQPLSEFHYDDYASYQYDSKDDGKSVQFSLYFTPDLRGFELIFSLDVDVASEKGLLLMGDAAHTVEYTLANCRGGLYMSPPVDLEKSSSPGGPND